MSEKQNGGNCEEVPLECIVLFNMHSMEALIDVLIEKGLVRFKKPDQTETSLIWTSTLSCSVSPPL